MAFKLRADSLAVAVGACAIPGIAVLALLAVAGDLRPVSAIAGGVGVVLAAFAAVARLRQWARSPVVAPEVTAVSAEGDLETVIARLEDSLGREIRERAEAQRGHRAVLDLLPDPLILLDRGLTVHHANRAARALFGDEPAGRPLAAMLRHPEVLEAAEGVASGAEPPVEIELSLPVPVARELTCRIAAFAKPSPDGVAVALVFRDLTQSKRVERMRADFVANASHEIRTPLAALGGYIETLLGPARDDSVARERFLKTMAEQVARMTRLVGDLLSLSRVELTEHTPPAEPVSVDVLIRRVVKALDFRAQARQASVDLILPADLPPVIGDEGELEQVFTNLIDNAIKYGRQGGTVHIDARVIDHVPSRAGWPGRARPVAIAISDQGPGIAREHLPRLTERFYRVDTARSRDLGGTGLGLAIVKHILNRHRGALTIDSTLGQGTTFTVYLPARD
ncbi:PAS domain-containing protein [Oleomonas cavernae]|uniref:histidine kinase n=1 Tax=Oleomonas cavernae TaxID=2320859 RepID=A0A418WHL8_9PROT|nr:ATP-binding protein [Oleomonas cavernae]RJF89531.1 PAS domain-containing protein [Oleomonas cavernae]